MALKQVSVPSSNQSGHSPAPQTLKEFEELKKELSDLFKTAKTTREDYEETIQAFSTIPHKIKIILRKAKLNVLSTILIIGIFSGVIIGWLARTLIS